MAYIVAPTAVTLWGINSLFMGSQYKGQNSRGEESKASKRKT